MLMAKIQGDNVARASLPFVTVDNVDSKIYSHASHNISFNKGQQIQ